MDLILVAYKLRDFVLYLDSSIVIEFKIKISTLQERVIEVISIGLIWSRSRMIKSVGVLILHFR